MSEDKILDAIRGEYSRYQRLVEMAIEQIDDEALFRRLGPDGNSVAILLVHLGGNLQSRFTDFLTSDGEKTWRNRDSEFEITATTRAEVLTTWNTGLEALEAALRDLRDDQMGNEVLIRGQALSVIAALERSLAHFAYHVGQIVLLSRHAVGSDWRILSIPRGATQPLNQNPEREKRPD
ncbi:MAG: DUF1572 family protein [Planctomycetes bacterium]|nr:DUF1572 family protein [Planctomycetota bacterium]